MGSHLFNSGMSLNIHTAMFQWTVVNGRVCLVYDVLLFCR